MRTTLFCGMALLMFLAGGLRLPAQPSRPTGAAPQAAFNIETATRAYLDRLTPEKKQKSDAYFKGRY